VAVVVAGAHAPKGVTNPRVTIAEITARTALDGMTLDLNFELFNVFNNWNFANPTTDQRLTDFLVLTAFTGGNGQPRAAQFSARFGF